MLEQVIYYIPFYFQTVEGVSLTMSGIRSIPLCLSRIVGVVASGIVIIYTGHYVSSQNPIQYNSKLISQLLTLQIPYMVLGQIICIVGTGLLTRIRSGTPTAFWATYLVITGLGHGIGLQLLFTALQVVLR